MHTLELNVMSHCEGILKWEQIRKKKTSQKIRGLVHRQSPLRIISLGSIMNKACVVMYFSFNLNFLLSKDLKENHKRKGLVYLQSLRKMSLQSIMKKAHVALDNFSSYLNHLSNDFQSFIIQTYIEFST